MGGHGWTHVMLWVGMGGHRSLLMVMVWVQIRRKMLGSDTDTTYIRPPWAPKPMMDMGCWWATYCCCCCLSQVAGVQVSKQDSQLHTTSVSLHHGV